MGFPVGVWVPEVMKIVTMLGKVLLAGIAGMMIEVNNGADISVRKRVQ